jgi:hypothetical protein
MLGKSLEETWARLKLPCDFNEALGRQNAGAALFQGFSKHFPNICLAAPALPCRRPGGA